MASKVAQSVHLSNRALCLHYEDGLEWNGYRYACLDNAAILIKRSPPSDHGYRY